MNQQLLLERYDEYRIAKETYITNLNQAELTNSETAAATAATAKVKMDAIQLEIPQLTTSIKESYGKYDTLYKTDENF